MYIIYVDRTSKKTDTLYLLLLFPRAPTASGMQTTLEFCYCCYYILWLLFTLLEEKKKTTNNPFALFSAIPQVPEFQDAGKRNKHKIEQKYHKTTPKELMLL